MRRALLAAVAAALHFAPLAGAWTWPPDGPVLQPFVFDPAHPYAAGQHRGIDIGAPPPEGYLAPFALLPPRPAAPAPAPATPPGVQPAPTPAAATDVGAPAPT